MAKQVDPQALETLRVRILADRVARLVRWVCFLAILAGLVLPLVVAAWRANGAISGLAVGALCVALAWSVKPQGASLGAQAREIDARYKSQD